MFNINYKKLRRINKSFIYYLNDSNEYFPLYYEQIVLYFHFIYFYECMEDYYGTWDDVIQILHLISSLLFQFISLIDIKVR